MLREATTEHKTRRDEGRRRRTRRMEGRGGGKRVPYSSREEIREKKKEESGGNKDVFILFSDFQRIFMLFPPRFNLPPVCLLCSTFMWL